MNSPDLFDTGIPKYSSALDIYDALCELTQTEEMGILSEMFSDVSYDGQGYYYTDKGSVLKDKFEEMSDYGNKMWIMDLAVWQIDQAEIHGLVWDALNNSDMARRLGFKKLFIDKMLGGDKSKYDKVAEDYLTELNKLDHFSNYEMIKAFDRVMQARGEVIYTTPYPNFAYSLLEKARNLNFSKEIEIIVECRALLTSYDDFMLGLRINQTLYTSLEGHYKNKVLQLQASYEEKIKQLLQIAEKQGVALTLELVKMLPNKSDE